MSTAPQTRFGLKHKLHIPTIINLILIVVAAMVFWNTNSLFDKLQAKQLETSKLGEELRNAALSLRDYLGGEISFQTLEGRYAPLLATLGKDEVGQIYRRVWGKAQKHRSLTQANQKIEDEITKLTETSVAQSNGFLKAISGKLADEEERKKVTKLERLVINGAAMNTTASLMVHINFLKAKENLGHGRELLAYLDTLLSNVKKDIKGLAGTPFAGLPLEAQKAQLRIKDLATQFLANARRQKQLQEAIFKDTNLAIEQVRTKDRLASGSFFGAIWKLMLTMLLVVAAAALLGAIISGWLAVSLSKAISRVASGLARAAGQVNQASGTVQRAAEELASGTSQQASSLEETSAALEEMSSMTQQNAENASLADSSMKEASGEMKQATGHMEELKTAMEKITAASDQMAKIVKSIDGIAFQTNLLALNAAVEAARAGEAGAGFAVVAEEVRNLAKRAAEAAKSTGELIEVNLKDIGQGSERLRETDDSFHRVGASADKVSGLLVEIAAASSEQAHGIEQLNVAASAMDQVTQTIAANAQDSAEASASLAREAVSVGELVNDLLTLVEGAGKMGNPPQADADRKPSGQSTALARKQDQDDFQDF